MSLVEFKGTRQDKSGTEKRWFSDSNMDVFIWSNTNELCAIEVLWQIDGHKHLWAWKLGEEGHFFKVDEGDKDPRKNLSDLVHLEYAGDYINLLSLIERNSGELPIEVMTALRMLA